ncbi:hypothetical protein GSF22_33350 [Micromonospora echinofusca]|uniref:Uncharacterized protein n=1 Tax=Micromonospora echinofusca TaxID=47858 RepID=A0ABS3W2L7_MICEH|nr:hypothetical protein [Micromonospora echinofusca]
MSDWRNLLVPDTPLWEIALRGTAIYLSIFFLLRVLLKRESVRMESEGHFSVITRDGDGPSGPGTG